MSDVLSIHSRAWTPAAILAAIISGTVGAATNTSYPDYSPLNYSLQDTYAGTTFFDNFDFFTNDDPTHRSVGYVSKATASSPPSELISATETRLLSGLIPPTASMR